MRARIAKDGWIQHALASKNALSVRDLHSSMKQVLLKCSEFEH